MLELELVLPAYNEGASLQKLLDRMVEAATTARMTPDNFRAVVVNNGSTDDTAEVLRRIQGTATGAWVHVVTVPKNKGYGFGLWSGLQATTAPVVGWTHADMQCDPRDAFAAFARVKAAPADVLVKGRRLGRNWKDRAVTRVFEAFARTLLGMDAGEINAQPKIFPRTLLAAVANPPHDFAFDLYVLFRARKSGFHIETIPVSFPPRIHGTSKWAASFFGRYRTILGMINYMWDLSRSEGRL